MTGTPVLVDTSVWIRALAGKEPWRTGLDKLLSRNLAAGHDLVYGELLIGDKGGRGALLDCYSRITQVPTIRHSEVTVFVRHHRLHGRGAGWIDIHLLAAVIVSGIRLWTADPRLEIVAAEFSANYTGSV